MKKSDVELGGTYLAKVSGQVVEVKLAATSPYGGWEAVNKKTGRTVRIRTAARLRSPASAAADALRALTARRAEKIEQELRHLKPESEHMRAELEAEIASLKAMAGRLA